MPTPHNHINVTQIHQKPDDPEKVVPKSGHTVLQCYALPDSQPQMLPLQETIFRRRHVFFPEQYDRYPGRYTEKQWKDATTVFAKEHRNALFAEMESAYGALYNLLLGKQSPQVQCVIETQENNEGKKDVVVGVASYGLPGFTEFRKLSATEKEKFLPGGRSTTPAPGLADTLLAAYVLEEEDLHGGNFGLMDVAIGIDAEGKRITKKRWCKIDHDRSLWSSITHKLLGERINHIGNASQKYPITTYDILHFPNVRDSDNYYFPTVSRLMGKQTYTQAEIVRMKKIGKSALFQDEKWEFLLKTMLLPESAIREAVTRNLSEENKELREQIISHVLMRLEKLKVTVLSITEFRIYLNNLTDDKKEEIKKKIFHNLMVTEKNTYKKTEKNNAEESNAAITQNFQSIIESSNIINTELENHETLLKSLRTTISKTRTITIAHEMRELAEENYPHGITPASHINLPDAQITKIRHLAIAQALSDPDDCALDITPEIKKQRQKIALEARYLHMEELILSPILNSYERLVCSMKSQPLGLSLKKIIEQLQKKLRIMVKNDLSYPNIYMSDIGRISRNIGQCFDQKMIETLKGGLTHENTNARSQFTQQLKIFSEKLSHSTSLTHQETLACEFACGTEIIKKEDTAHSNDPCAPTTEMKAGYTALLKTSCNKSEMPLKSEAYLLMRDRLRDNSVANVTRCRAFAVRSTVTKSSIGKILAASVLGLAGMVLTAGLCLSIFGLAAAPLVAAITAKGIAAMIGTSVATGAAGVTTTGYAAAKTYHHIKTKAVFKNANTLFKAIPDAMNAPGNTERNANDDAGFLSRVFRREHASSSHLFAVY